MLTFLDHRGQIWQVATVGIVWNFALWKVYHIQLHPVRQVPSFNSLTTLTPLGLTGIYITWGYGLQITGYTFWSAIKNFSANCQVLRSSIILLPRHSHVFNQMAHWQSNNKLVFVLFIFIYLFFNNKLAIHKSVSLRTHSRDFWGKG